ncbi:MAG: HD domain-containing protein [Odoribacter splanchnicus]
MNAMTEQTYRPIILSKYTAVLKSCRNLISSEDIRLIRKAFKIAIQNETEASELNYQEIVRILDITLIITQEIGLGRTSIICAMLHKTVEKEMITLEQIREMFGEKVEQIIKGLRISATFMPPADCKLEISENCVSFAEDIRVQLIFWPKNSMLYGRLRSFGSRTKTAGHGNQLYLHPFCPSIGFV